MKDDAQQAGRCMLADKLTHVDFRKHLPSEAATAAVGRSLALLARPGDVLALSGDLGVGKTVLARAFIRARCGHVDEIPSPTFTLVQLYDPTPPFMTTVYHFDLYRLNGPEEAFELGIEDAFADGISLIEWPDRLGDLLPAARLDADLRYADAPGHRILTLRGSENWAKRLVALGEDVG